MKCGKLPIILSTVEPGRGTSSRSTSHLSGKPRTPLLGGCVSSPRHLSLPASTAMSMSMTSETPVLTRSIIRFLVRTSGQQERKPFMIDWQQGFSIASICRADLEHLGFTQEHIAHLSDE